MLWHIACIMRVPANHTQTSRELQVDWLSIPISSVLIHVARSCCVAVVYLMMYAFLSKTIWMNVLQCGFHLTMQAAALLAHIYFCLDNSSSYLYIYFLFGLRCSRLVGSIARDLLRKRHYLAWGKSIEVTSMCFSVIITLPCQETGELPSRMNAKTCNSCSFHGGLLCL